MFIYTHYKHLGPCLGNHFRVLNLENRHNKDAKDSKRKKSFGKKENRTVDLVEDDTTKVLCLPEQTTVSTADIIVPS